MQAWDNNKRNSIFEFFFVNIQAQRKACSSAVQRDVSQSKVVYDSSNDSTFGSHRQA